MKQIIVTDKGIGMAEMPENRGYEEDYHWKAKAISEALYFEDQERVREFLPVDCFSVGTASHYPSSWKYAKPDRKSKLVPGTYPIPPDFPKVVEVRQYQFKVGTGLNTFGDWFDVDKSGLVHPQIDAEYRTILRFVDMNTPEKQAQKEILKAFVNEDLVQAAADRLESLQAELTELKTHPQVLTLMARIEALEAENERLKAKIDGINKTLHKVARNKDEFQSKIDKLEKENAELQMYNNTWEAEFRKAIAENERLKKYKSLLSKRFLENEKTWVTQIDELVALQSKLDRVTQWCNNNPHDFASPIILDLLK
jgi:FtsZ-binding cell division protein ZapB